MAEVELDAYSASSHSMSQTVNKPLFFAFTMLLYLAFRGGWLDMTYGTSGFGPWVQNSGFKIIPGIQGCFTLEK
jgi:hypothetical protein